MEIKHLVRQGMPKAKVARQCGVCRQTVYNQVERQTLEAAPRHRATKLEPYKAYVRSRLEKFDLPATPRSRHTEKTPTLLGAELSGEKRPFFSKGASGSP